LIEYRGADEVVFLSTCNRVEIYGRTERRGLEILSALAQALPHELGKNWREACGVYLHEGCVPWWWASPKY
jgi:glutamyl-tRNA reductase